MGPLIYVAKQCLKWFIDNIDNYITDKYMRVWKTQAINVLEFWRNMIVSAVEPTGVALISVVWLRFLLVRSLMLWLIIRNAIWAVALWLIIISVFVMITINYNFVNSN